MELAPSAQRPHRRFPAIDLFFCLATVALCQWSGTVPCTAASGRSEPPGLRAALYLPTSLDWIPFSQLDRQTRLLQHTTLMCPLSSCPLSSFPQSCDVAVARDTTARRHEHALHPCSHTAATFGPALALNAADPSVSLSSLHRPRFDCTLFSKQLAIANCSGKLAPAPATLACLCKLPLSDTVC